MQQNLPTTSSVDLETDKVIEIYLNKDTKTSGRTVQFPKKCYCIEMLGAKCNEAMRNCFQEHLHEYIQADFTPFHIIKDESDVQSI